MNRGRKNYRFSQKTIENLRALVEFYEGKYTETNIVERAIQKAWEETWEQRWLKTSVQEGGP